MAKASLRYASFLFFAVRYLSSMTPKQLRRKIQSMRDNAPITAEFECVLTELGIWSRNGVWYATQKQHWLGWLKEYDGPGYRSLCHQPRSIIPGKQPANCPARLR